MATTETSWELLCFWKCFPRYILCSFCNIFSSLFSSFFIFKSLFTQSLYHIQVILKFSFSICIAIFCFNNTMLHNIAYAKKVPTYNQIFLEKRNGTPNYDLLSTPSQGLIVLRTLHIQVQTDSHKMGFRVSYKHVHVMCTLLL